MNDYIKREDAENAIIGCCEESALYRLRNLPSADVVEVKHAKDVGYEGSYGWVTKCSLCGTEFMMPFKGIYCPTCGALFDEFLNLRKHYEIVMKEVNK